jgi:hypothetical protein
METGNWKSIMDLWNISFISLFAEMEQYVVSFSGASL